MLCGGYVRARIISDTYFKCMLLVGRVLWCVGAVDLKTCLASGVTLKPMRSGHCIAKLFRWALAHMPLKPM